MDLLHADLDTESARDVAFLRIAFADVARALRCDCSREMRPDVRLVDVGQLGASGGRGVLAIARCARRFRSHRWTAVARLDVGQTIPMTRFTRAGE